jgi:hypothetical protein
MFEFGRLSVWIIDGEGYREEKESFVDVRDETVVIDPDLTSCSERSALGTLSGKSQVGVSVENFDCAGIPERLSQDGGFLDSEDQDGGSGCPGVKDGGSG